MDNQSKWVANGNPPACQFPIIPQGSLLDFSQPISLLQPGQVRGGSYKPHGGFRFSTYGTFIPDIKIYVPFDGVVTAAAQYKIEGTFQFLVNIVSPCGFMVRLGHLYIPSAQFTQILSNLPAPVEGDSRETFLNPPIPVKAGDLIASSVGMPPPASPDSMGSFMDFGLWDLRARTQMFPLISRQMPIRNIQNIRSAGIAEIIYRKAIEHLSQDCRANGDLTSTYCK